MPDPVPSARRIAETSSWALREVEDALKQFGGELVPLDQEALKAYNTREIKAGWRLSVKFPDVIRRLDILLPPSFPWQAPQVALVDRPRALTWPHIEYDGVLCLGPSTLETNPLEPVGVVKFLLGESCTLIEKLRRGECDQDFSDEFLSYWRISVDYRGGPIISLLNPLPPSRLIRIWRGKTQYVLADTDDEIEKWLVNRYGSKPAGFKTELAPYLWIGRAPNPSEYPRSVGDLRARLLNDEANALLCEAASFNLDKLVSLIAVSTSNGPALSAVILSPQRNHGQRPQSPITKGFRPGHVPKEILVERYLAGARLQRGEVERADAGWIHGRDKDARASTLRRKAVAVIGCGSIGAPIAIALSQAGVGTIHLFDSDILVWANIGRYPLGAPHIGEYKAAALAKQLRINFPHTSVHPHVGDANAHIRENLEALQECDLVISATGSWAIDALLDAWQHENARILPILYAWTEPHACAGHAILIANEADSLRAGFSPTGQSLLRVTNWPLGSTLQQAPACGALYQPYGPIELGFICCLASELALDALLTPDISSIHRVWAGAQRRLTSLGGEWTKEWLEIADNRSDGSFIMEMAWGRIGRAPTIEAIAA